MTGSDKTNRTVPKTRQTTHLGRVFSFFLLLHSPYLLCLPPSLSLSLFLSVSIEGFFLAPNYSQAPVCGIEKQLMGRAHANLSREGKKHRKIKAEMKCKMVHLVGLFTSSAGAFPLLH